jgi:hypothetical protein
MTVLEIPADRYHADDISGAPCLSSSIANLLLTASPAHARAAHPKLNPGYERTSDEKFDRGTAAHQLLLEGSDDRVFVIHADNWRTKDAQLMRDEAREQGRIPLLASQWREVKEMVDQVRDQIADHPARPLTVGRPEQTLVWEEDGVWCKARLDWLRDDHAEVWDVKTTSRSANPQAWARTVWSTGYAVQAAFYRRGVRACFGVDPEWRWLVVENAPPYALSVSTLAPDAWAIADAQVDAAIARWRTCLESDEWPAYRAEVAHIEAPGWLESQWLQYEEVMP